MIKPLTWCEDGIGDLNFKPQVNARRKTRKAKKRTKVEGKKKYIRDLSSIPFT